MGKGRYYREAMAEVSSAREVRIVVSVMTDEITDLKAEVARLRAEVDRKEGLLRESQARVRDRLPEWSRYVQVLSHLLDLAGIAYPYFPLGEQDVEQFTAAVKRRFSTVDRDRHQMSVGRTDG